MNSRMMRTCLAVGVVAGLAVTGGVVALARPAQGAVAPASRSRLGLITLCKPFERRTVSGPWGNYIIRNDVFQAPRIKHPAQICIGHRAAGPTFHITSEVIPPGPQVRAFPEILYGCAWGLCSPGSGMPRSVTRLRGSWVSAFDRLPPGQHGKWNAALDIWFSKRKHTGGQAAGAELMVWMATRGMGPWPAHRGVRHVTIDGIKFSVIEWITSGGGGPRRWPLVIFRRQGDGKSFVRRLRLQPLIGYAERRGWIRQSYWLEGVHSGFELWGGGAGLRVQWFRVHL